MTTDRTNRFDFVGPRKMFAVLSAILCVCSAALFILIGPTWGIDFTGGTELHLKFEKEIDVAKLRSSVSSADLADVSVQQVGAEDQNEYVIRIQNPEDGTEGIQSQIETALKDGFGEDFIETSSFDAQVGVRLVIKYIGEERSSTEIAQVLKDIPNVTVQDSPDDNTFSVKLPGQISKVQERIAKDISPDFDILQTDSVGPKVGGELRRQGAISILATLGLILVYVALRFNLSFAPGAVLALLHDVTIVIGLFILLDTLSPHLPFEVPALEFNLPMVGALLTIIGYSLNDTIVIYDRIRENMERYRKKDMENLINTSINETLRRTINTSVTTLCAMAAFLVFGGAVIQTFALAIFLGVIVGTYSTIYVASPTILVMQDIQPYLSKVFSPAATAGSEGK